MDEAETYPPELELDEVQELVAHRTVALYKLGFSFEQVQQLPLLRADIAHTAKALLDRGAPHWYVVLELKED